MREIQTGKRLSAKRGRRRGFGWWLVDNDDDEIQTKTKNFSEAREEEGVWLTARLLDLGEPVHGLSLAIALQLRIGLPLLTGWIPIEAYWIPIKIIHFNPATQQCPQPIQSSTYSYFPNWDSARKWNWAISWEGWGKEEEGDWVIAAFSPRISKDFLTDVTREGGLTDRTQRFFKSLHIWTGRAFKLKLYTA